MEQSKNKSSEEVKKVKLTFVGDSTVGKTSIILTWTQERFPEYHEVTVFDTWMGEKSYKNQQIELSIFDTAGHEDLGSMRPIAYPGTDCFLICYAVDNRESLRNACTKWLNEVRTCAKKVPVILVGTKSDLKEEAKQRERGLTNEDGTPMKVYPDDFVTSEEQLAAAKQYNF